jgi:glycosyltransferase involved in cell wall biosynthesis
MRRNSVNIIDRVVSEEIKRVIRLVLNFKKNCSIISNGINIIDITKINKNVIPFQKQNGYKYFIYPARYQESKGHKFLLEAFKQLTIEVSNVKLILIGTNLENNLKNIVSILNIENCVIFLNPIDDINKILAHCDFGVFPSFYEGHSIALCEMMAIGLPIVASDIIGNREVTDNGKAALLYRVDSVEHLYNSMHMLIKDKSFANALGSYAQKYISDKYSMQEFFIKYDTSI